MDKSMSLAFQNLICSYTRVFNFTLLIYMMIWHRIYYLWKSIGMWSNLIVLSVFQSHSFSQVSQPSTWCCSHKVINRHVWMSPDKFPSITMGFIQVRNKCKVRCWALLLWFGDSLEMRGLICSPSHKGFLINKWSICFSLAPRCIYRAILSTVLKGGAPFCRSGDLEVLTTRLIENQTEQWWQHRLSFSQVKHPILLYSWFVHKSKWVVFQVNVSCFYICAVDSIHYSPSQKPDGH